MLLVWFQLVTQIILILTGKNYRWNMFEQFLNILWDTNWNISVCLNWPEAMLTPLVAQILRLVFKSDWSILFQLKRNIDLKTIQSANQWWNYKKELNFWNIILLVKIFSMEQLSTSGRLRVVYSKNKYVIYLMSKNDDDVIT